MDSRRSHKLIIKRLIDIFVSVSLGLLLAPFLLMIALVVKVTSKGPVFFPWEVVGLNNKDVKSYKFRSMVKDADDKKAELEQFNEMKGPVFKIKNDPRITRVGAVLRKFSLDELPQLYSVLKGDMSLVGPRPPNRKEVERFKPWQMRKLSVKPGITCLWQVIGRNQITDFDQWVSLDLEYIDNWSLWLDFKVLLKTIGVVFAGTGQ